MKVKKKEVSEIEGMEERLQCALRKVERLESELKETSILNRLNASLIPTGRKAYFFHGPIEYSNSLRQVGAESNWPWREHNRKCGRCGCYLFAERELDRKFYCGTESEEFTQASREALLNTGGRGDDVAAEIQKRILVEPELFSRYFYVRSMKLPFGEQSTLFFHEYCFNRILTEGIGPDKLRASD